MASNYQLNLKAILDSSQVKQELQNLRQMQNQILGNNRGNSVRGGNSNNLNNLNGLNSTLSRLTNSINQLNNAISKLNVFNQKSMPVVSSKSNNGMLPIGGNSALSQLIADKERASLINERAILHQRATLNRLILTRPNDKQSIADVKYKIKELENYGNELPTLYNKSVKNTQEIQKRNIGSNLTPEMKRMMGGMAFGQGFNAVSMGLEQTGLSQEANIVSGVGKIGSYAVMGSSAGLLGAGIGAGIGAIEFAATLVVDSFKEAADAATEMAQRINQAKTVDTTIKDFFETKETERAYNTNNRKYFDDKISSLSEEYKIKKLVVDDALKTFGSGGLEAYEKETARMYEEGFDGRNNNKLLGEADYRKSIADNYKKTVNELLAIDKKLQSYKSYSDQFKKQDEEAKTRDEEILRERNNINLSIANEKLLNARFDENLANQNLIKSATSIDDLQSGLQKYKSLSSKDKSAYLNFLEKAANENDNTLKKDLLNKATEYKSSWQFNESQFNMFNSAIPSLLDSVLNSSIKPLQDKLNSLQAPDMSNVNSLAGQGVMINRADDNSRQESLLNYQKQQTDLQEQIKNLLKSNSFTSTIM